MTPSRISEQLLSAAEAVVAAHRISASNGSAPNPGLYISQVTPALAKLRTLVKGNLVESVLCEDPLELEFHSAMERLVFATVPAPADFEALLSAHQRVRAAIDGTASDAMATVRNFSAALPSSDRASVAAKAAIETILLSSQGLGIQSANNLIADYDSLIDRLVEGRDKLCSSLGLPQRHPRLLPESALLRTSVQRWDVQSDEEQALSGEPEYELEIDFDPATSQAWVTLAPAGAQNEPTILPQLTMLIEVNGGLPCAHISGDIHGDLELSVFGKPGAQLGVRPGDAEFTLEDKQYLPEAGAVIESIATLQGDLPRERVK